MNDYYWDNYYRNNYYSDDKNKSSSFYEDNLTFRIFATTQTDPTTHQKWKHNR